MLFNRILSIASFTQSNLPPPTNGNLEFSLPIMSKLFYGWSVLKTSAHSVLAEVSLSSNHIPVNFGNSFQSKLYLIIIILNYTMVLKSILCIQSGNKFNHSVFFCCLFVLPCVDVIYSQTLPTHTIVELVHLCCWHCFILLPGEMHFVLHWTGTCRTVFYLPDGGGPDSFAQSKPCHRSAPQLCPCPSLSNWWGWQSLRWHFGSSIENNNCAFSHHLPKWK